MKDTNSSAFTYYELVGSNSRKFSRFIQFKKKEIRNNIDTS